MVSIGISKETYKRLKELEATKKRFVDIEYCINYLLDLYDSEKHNIFDEEEMEAFLELLEKPVKPIKSKYIIPENRNPDGSYTFKMKLKKKRVE